MYEFLDALLTCQTAPEEVQYELHLELSFGLCGLSTLVSFMLSTVEQNRDSDTLTFYERTYSNFSYIIIFQI